MQKALPSFDMHILCSIIGSNHVWAALSLSQGTNKTWYNYLGFTFCIICVHPSYVAWETINTTINPDAKRCQFIEWVHVPHVVRYRYTKLSAS
jgi:hypothetical protein